MSVRYRTKEHIALIAVNKFLSAFSGTKVIFANNA
jgi:hypothetical protein